MARKPVKRAPAKRKAKPHVAAPIVAPAEAIAKAQEILRRNARQERIDIIAIFAIGLAMIAFAFTVVMHMPLPR